MSLTIRFSFAVGPETWSVNRDDFAHTTVEQLRAAKQQGACGLKLFKQFGLEYRNSDG